MIKNMPETEDEKGGRGPQDSAHSLRKEIMRKN